MSSILSHVSKALLVLPALLAAGVAQARTFSATELSYDNALLSNFNLVTLGNLNVTGSSGAQIYTDGRVLVGGNVSIGAGVGYGGCSTAAGRTATCAGNATVGVDSTNQKYGAMTVFGNVTAASGAFYGAGYGTGGTEYIKGSANGIFYAANKSNLNVGGSVSGLTVDSGKTTTTTTALTAAQKTGTQTGSSYVVTSAANAFPFAATSVSSTITAQVTSLANGIAALPGSPGVTAQALPSNATNSGVFFTANNDFQNAGLKYGVITTTLANLATQTNFQGINNGTNDATLVIVTGNDMDSTSASYNASLLLPNLNSYTGSNKVIFDFVDAKVLKFGGNWSGSILAPLATISAMGGVIDGSVIVNSLSQTQALYATNLFTGNLSGLVPEPASLALLGVGVVAAAWARRRHK